MTKQNTRNAPSLFLLLVIIRVPPLQSTNRPIDQPQPFDRLPNQPEHLHKHSLMHERISLAAHPGKICDTTIALLPADYFTTSVPKTTSTSRGA